jgi:hypothetical protein
MPDMGHDKPCRLGVVREADILTSWYLNCIETDAAGRKWPENGPKWHRRRTCQVWPFGYTQRVGQTSVLCSRSRSDKILYDLLDIFCSKWSLWQLPKTWRNRNIIFAYVCTYVFFSIVTQLISQNNLCFKIVNGKESRYTDLFLIYCYFEKLTLFPQ